MAQRVAIIREQLEDREIANWLPLADTYRLSVITSQFAGPYSATGLGLPVTRLATRRQRVGGPSQRLNRVTERVIGQRVDLDPMIGLEDAVTSADLAVVNETHLASSAQLAQLRAEGGPRLVTVCYENIPFRYEEDPRVRARKDLVRKFTDRFVAMTKGARQALVAEGVSEKRIDVVTYGVDLNRFPVGLTNDPLRIERRRSWGASPGDVVVLFTGRLLPEKGLVPLVHAVSMLPAALRTRVQLVFVGAGPEAERIVSARHGLQLTDRVSLHPWVEPAEVPGVLTAADVFAMPSLPTPYWEEQLGFSMVEAMASGLPVLGIAAGCIPEVLGTGGLVVPPYNTSALAAGLARLVNDADLRAQLGQLGRARAQADLSTTVVAAKLARTLNQTAS